MIFLPPLFFHGGNIFLEVLTAPFLKHFPNRIILKWNGSSLFKEELSVPSVSTSSFAPAPNPAVCFVWLLISSWWLWPQLTAASCVSAVFPEAFVIADTVFLLTSCWAFKALLFMHLLLTSHLTSSTFLLEKSFIIFAPLSLVFTRIPFWFSSSRYMTTKHQTRK